MKLRNMRIFTFLLTLSILTSCGSIVYQEYKPINKESNQVIYKKVNEFNDDSYYRHKTYFLSALPSSLYLYISERGNRKHLRGEFRYDGRDWIFFDNATILNSEKEKINFSFNSFDRNTNVKSSSNGVSEEFDVKINDSKAKDLLNLLKSNKGKIKLRLSGKNSHRDYVLKESHINSFIELLEFYFK